MAREDLQLQLDNLKWNIDQLEAENARLRDDISGNAAVLDEDNVHLVLDSGKKKRKSRRSMDPTVQTEADLPVEQQHRLGEDLQAELAEAVERSQALEDRCCQLEEQLLRVNENGLERLRALEALRSESEAREDRLVEQVRGLQQQMQEMQLQ